MERISMPELQEVIEHLTKILMIEKYCYVICCRYGDRDKASQYKQRIIRSCNRIADLSARMEALHLSGETDLITTENALRILKIDFTRRDSAFYINS